MVQVLLTVSYQQQYILQATTAYRNCVEGYIGGKVDSGLTWRQ